MITSTRERRDWTLLIFIIPIGIILMLIAGQVAIRLVPIWSVDAGMKSKLDPNNLPKQQSGLVQPILPAILTPLGWFDTFLTPGAGGNDQNIIFPPFIVFEPSATPAVTLSPPAVVTTQAPPTLPVTAPPTVVVTQPTSSTLKPPPEGGETPTPPTAPPTTPPTVPPTTPPTAPPTAPPITSTPPLLYISVAPPLDLEVNTPANGTPADILPGTYTVVYLGIGGVHVSNGSDGNYDLIFYEALAPLGTGTSILLDQISFGITNDSTGSSYYEVFNWGDNVPDTNTNVDFNKLPADCVQECDNRVIPSTSLYTDPVSSVGTGILIDVDKAPSAPPEGDYQYLVIISPLSPDSAQVDAVVVAEVPIPP